MSELFKTLKSRPRVTPPPETPQAPLVFEPSKAAPPPEIPTEKPAGGAISALQPRFNLELADSRIRVVLDPRTQPGEQFRFLRARLTQMQKSRQITTLLVTSSAPREGKTFTACCLAGILAQEPGKRVLLVDADLRKPSAAANLGVDETQFTGGLAQVLAGTSDLEHSLLASSSMNFFFLPAGAVSESPSDLLASTRLESTVARMSEIFDWVIIDSPPVLALADPSRLAPLCDAVLMVVQANKTPAKAVQKAVQAVGRDLVCGVVLNRVNHLSSNNYYERYSPKKRWK